MKLKESERRIARAGEGGGRREGGDSKRKERVREGRRKREKEEEDTEEGGRGWSESEMNKIGRYESENERQMRRGKGEVSEAEREKGLEGRDRGDE